MTRIHNIAFLYVLFIATVSTQYLQAQISESSFQHFSQAMDVNVIDETFQYTGTCKTSFRYTGPDTLTALFYHAYFNAFQRGSAAYIRAQETDNRISPILEGMKDDEFGYLEANKARINGVLSSIERDGTIIRFTPPSPIYPGDSVVVEFQFEGKVPLIMRRAGRSSKEGIRYSMAQWYPKLCQYDQHGWHNNQYVEREYYGVWGKYDVKLTLPAKYVVGASGMLQNAKEVGRGYDAIGDTIVRPLSKDSLNKLYPSGKITWHFIADAVHDFAWVADDDYTHVVYKRGNLTVHSLHKSYVENFWSETGKWSADIIAYFGNLFGEYPYSTFTCAQAGDGGMEYPGLIMVTSGRSKRDLLRVIAHELAHQWFYGLVGSNEILHAWMDEGFTSYAEDRIMRELYADSYLSEISWWRNLFIPEQHPVLTDSRAYFMLMGSGYEEPLCTMHDLFSDGYNARMVYDKGSSILKQLEYSFGQQQFDSCFKAYALKWRFKHPYPADFERHCEDCFGQRLDEFFQNLVASTDTINYAIKDFSSNRTNNNYTTSISLHKTHRAALPLTLYLQQEDGTYVTKHIPSSTRTFDRKDATTPWHWSVPYKTVTVESAQPIVGVALDTTMKLLDSYYGDNAVGSGTFLGTPMRAGFMQRYDLIQPLPYYGISYRPTAWMLPDDRFQIGVRADGFIDRDRHAITTGVYYNFEQNEVNFQLGYSDLLPILGRGSRYEMRLYSMDDMSGFETEFTIPFGENFRTRNNSMLYFGFSFRHFDLFNDVLFKEDLATFAEAGIVTPLYDGLLRARVIGGGHVQTGVALQARWFSPERSISVFNWKYFATLQLVTGEFQNTFLTTHLDSDPLPDRLDQTAYRFTRFLNDHFQENRVFQRGGAGFVAFRGEGVESVLALANEISYPLGENHLRFLPIFNTLELGSYQAIALVHDYRAPLIQQGSGIITEIGVYADISLPAEFSLALPYVQDLSLRVALPLLARLPNGDKLPDTGIRLGVGATIP